jgi:hypothetical protein
MSKNETKKKSITQKDIEKIQVKKILIREQIKFFNWRLKLN